MNYPVDAKLLALATGFHALAVALHENGALDAQRFLGHVAAAHRRLADTEGPIVANALQDMMEPIARHLGYSAESVD